VRDLPLCLTSVKGTDYNGAEGTSVERELLKVGTYDLPCGRRKEREKGGNFSGK